MKDGWRDRLRESLEASGLSMRKASLGAGLAHGYISGLLAENKTPTVESLTALAETLNVSASYLAFGYDMDAQSEEIIRMLAKNPDARAGILQILRSQRDT